MDAGEAIEGRTFAVINSLRLAFVQILLLHAAFFLLRVILGGSTMADASTLGIYRFFDLAELDTNS